MNLIKTIIVALWMAVITVALSPFLLMTVILEWRRDYRNNNGD